MSRTDFNSLTTSSVKALEHQRSVGAAEAERVREDMPDLHVVLAGSHDRHVGERRIELFDVGAFADEAIVHHQERVDRFLHAGSAEGVAGERLRRGDRRALVAGAEHRADGLDLLVVADGRRGGVRVDVVDRPLHGRKCHVHAAHRAFARGSDHVVAVRRGAVPDELAVDAGTACLGVLEFLEHNDAGAARDDEAVAVHVVGPRGLRRRLVVLRRHGAHGVEQHRQRPVELLATAGEDDVLPSALDDLERVADAVVRRRTGGRDRVVHALDLEPGRERCRCIGNAFEIIQGGRQDIIFAGGSEELDWTLSVLFDAMGAMSTKYNETPTKASRAYDVNRDGFVIAGGAGVVVLEELEHAKARGARIYGELVGYGATSDGYDMVAPSGEGAIRCMRLALSTVKGPIDYINPHATSTPVSDDKEIEAIRAVFGAGDKCPPISATKSLTGHSLGATGVQEAIYSLLMMNNGFICESANIEELDPAFSDMPIVRARKDDVKIGHVLSNSFGFGGTNATLVFKRLDA